MYVHLVVNQLVQLSVVDVELLLLHREDRRAVVVHSVEVGHSMVPRHMHSVVVL